MSLPAPESSAPGRRGLPGMLVVVVGPDGVGKTTVARELVDTYAPRSSYFHFRPPGRGRLLSEVPDLDPRPKVDRQVWRVTGWVRIVVAVVRFWWGYLTTVRPQLRKGHVVVADRWAYGYLAQPRPLKFAGPAWMARLAVKAMPRPDLVINLVAPAEVIVSRKRELSRAQVESELRAWVSLPVELVSLDATMAPAELGAAARGLIGR